MFYFEEHMASSFSSDHNLHRNFLKNINLLCMCYDASNRLENERESNEEPSSTYRASINCCNFVFIFVRE